MKLFRYIPKSAAALALVLTASSCSLFDLDNTDPNNPSIAAPDLLLTQVEFKIADEFSDLETTLATFMGQVGTQKTSRFELQNSAFNEFWFDMYTGPLKDVNNLIEATSANNNTNYLGIAQLLKAYMNATMVDLFGDIPYSQAGKGDASTPVNDPEFDKDADVYADCLKLVDDGLANLAKGSGVAVTGDLIYGGSVPNWTAFGKSLRLKLLMTSRLGTADAKAKIDAAIKAGGFLTSDFRFVFSKTPTSLRHPWYTGAYTGGEFDGSYVNHQLMTEMLKDGDPRFPFYFKRQGVKALNPNDATDRGTIPSPCEVGYIYLRDAAYWESLLRKPKADFKKADTTFMIGLFGRDRGDAAGIPADGALRTLPGVYPAGGFYDKVITAADVPRAEAAPGGGVYNMLSSENIAYYQIEAILALDLAGDAKKLFETAMRSHATKVVNFGAGADPANAIRPTSAAVDAWVKVWLDRYDGAPTNTAKLDVCMKQLWFSSWGGSSYETYNGYRRTGLPSTLQEACTKTSRNFPLRLPYPQSEISLNNSASAKAAGAKIYDKDPIFWDK